MVRPKTNRGNRNKRNNSNVRRNHSRTKNNRKRKANSSDDDFILQFSDSDSSTTSRRPPKRRLRSQRNSSPQRLRTRSHIAESGSSTECFPAEPRRRRQNYLPSDDTDSDSPLKPLQAKKRAIPVCGTDDSSSDSDSSIGSFSSYFQSFSDDSVESSADDWNLRPRYMRSGRSRSSATTVRRRNRRNNGSTSASSASRANAVSSTLRLSDGAGLRGHRSFNAMSTGGIYLRPRNNGLARVGDRPPTPGPSSRRTTLLDDSDLSSIEDSPSPLQSSALNRRSAATFGRVVLTIHGPNNFEIPERAPQTHEVEVLNAPDTDTEDQVETATVTVAEVDPSGYISSDGESDKCPICLIKFVEQEVGVPGCCEHNFCATCIVKWADSSTTCPVDRLAFTTVTVMRRYGGKPLRRLHFQARTLPAESMDIQIHDHVTCVVCRISGREEELAFCDRCVRPYHITCLTPPLATVPDSWYCPTCTIYNEQSEPGRQDISSLLMDLFNFY